MKDIILKNIESNLEKEYKKISATTYNCYSGL